MRDITDSLGKLPPAAVDLEEAVLGALMLERRALEVLPLLIPNHFYTEVHKEIYRAITDLATAKNPIDMRTVVAQLRSNGKIELIGGAHYIAELTSKVSSASNIMYHARVIIQMAIKREMIQLASRVHHAAYDDTSDALELLESTLTSFKSLQETEVTAPLSEQIKTTWAEIMIADEPPEQTPLITIYGTPAATQGNHSLIIGKKKSRKSLFITWELGEFLKHHSEAAVFDTEQGQRHVWKYRDRVFRQSGKLIPFFFMRGKSPKERMMIIEQTLEYWPVKLKLIVIDGIRDLISNINDPDQCSDLIVWLEKIILKYNVHVVNVLHLNKTDNNARGHIGSELLNKAEISIELELDEKTNVTVVKCESSREKGFENFAFTHSHDDLPMLTDTPMSGEIIPNEEQKNRLVTIFEAGPLGYKALIEALKDDFAIGERKAKQKISEFKRSGWIMANGERGSKNMTYKLNFSSNGHSTQPPEGFRPLHKVEEKLPDPIAVEPEKVMEMPLAPELPF